jgi:F-type H+-transporting ATPase subunit delta
MTNGSSEQSLQTTLQEAARHRTVMDVGAQRVGKVYAEAILNAAEKQNLSGEVLHEFDGVVYELFRVEPQFEMFLGSAAIGRDRKQELIEKTFSGRATDVFVNFLLVLNKHDRLDVLRAIHAAYGELYDTRSGRIRVQVTSAVPLPDDQAEKLRQEIRSKFNREPVLDTRLDPDLIAGMVVQVGDWKLDSSIQSRLHHIREELVERCSYEIQSRRDRFSSPNGN